MLNKNNKMISLKVSKDVYSFIETFSRKYKVSVSSFCQDCVTKAILEHDRESQKEQYKTPDCYYRKLAFFINESYDSRRK